MKFAVFDVGSASGPEKSDSYSFRGPRRTHIWPKSNGSGLGSAGVYNALLRVGFRPESTTPGAALSPRSGDVLFVVASTVLHPQECDAIDNWMKADGTVVASGCSPSWKAFLPSDVEVSVSRDDKPYSGLAFVFDGRRPELVAPSKWDFVRISGRSPRVETFGRIGVVHGDRQSPDHALMTLVPDAPAVLRRNRFVFLNGNIFAAFQAWLQGQEDLEPWMAWRSRLFWLDEYAAFIRGVLADAGVLSPTLVPSGVRGLGATTVVLRHDLDHSRDTTYLELERKAGVAAVHAVLKDENTDFWIRTLREHPDHEVAFHYNTASSPRYANAVRTRLLGLAAISYRPVRHAVVGGGLLKQVQWARRAGIGVETLHRHLSFIYYPEYIDALDAVLEHDADVLGGSSFFRGTVLRWGADRVDGSNGTYSHFPDARSPYWFPFRLAHAGDGGRLLRGWETTSMLEAEPGLVEQLLRCPVALPQRVIVLDYHPAHANRPNFTAAGSVVWFREVLDLIKSRNVHVMTLRDVFSILNAHVS